MPSKVPVDWWEGADMLQFVCEAYPTHALLDSSLRCNSGATCAVTSTHITIILESLSKPGDDTLCDSKSLGYFQLGTSTFQSSNNST
ncbi:uncharacterized protein TNCV_2389111 [Trichonephila clavipes]|nr:uncharacterized protein TNCV_2389111 [Trichonephila clavipes]